MTKRKPDAKRLEGGAHSPSFEDLRGLLKEALHSLGGGEAFMRGERSWGTLTPIIGARKADPPRTEVREGSQK